MFRRELFNGLLGLGALASWPLRSLATQAESDVAAERLGKGAAFLERHVSVDVHAHPGRFFLSRGAAVDPSLSPLASHFEGEVIPQMLSGKVTAGCFSTVGDLPAIQAMPGGGLAGTKPVAPGGLYESHLRQLEALRDILRRDNVMPVLEAGDLAKAHHVRKLGAVLCVEGADFLEGELTRLEEAHDDDIRLITIVHYRPNEIGDIQTAPERFGGITPYGAEVVHELNRLGMVIDLAHATKKLVQAVCAITRHPVIASHTNLAGDEATPHPRLIDRDYAKAIADTGGLVGAWPAGIGTDGFDGFIDNILRLVENIGVEHVAIGTDMDANYRPVFDSYENWPLIPAALLERGMSEPETAAVMGENFRRVFAANREGTKRSDQG